MKITRKRIDRKNFHSFSQRNSTTTSRTIGFPFVLFTINVDLILNHKVDTDIDKGRMMEGTYGSIDSITSLNIISFTNS